MTVRWRLMISCSFNVKLYLKVHTLHLWEDSLVMPLIIRTAGMCLYYIFKRTHGSTLGQTFLKWRTTFALCKHRLQKALSEKPIISSMLLLVTIFFFLSLDQLLLFVWCWAIFLFPSPHITLLSVLHLLPTHIEKPYQCWKGNLWSYFFLIYAQHLMETQAWCIMNNKK